MKMLIVFCRSLLPICLRQMLMGLFASLFLVSCTGSDHITPNSEINKSLEFVEYQDNWPSWKIVSAADWHSAELGVKSPNPEVFLQNQDNERKKIKGITDCQPEVVLIAGDIGVGHWTKENLIGGMEPGESLEEAIYRLGEKTFCTHKKNFIDAGVDNLIVSVGDHDIGDNDWPAGSEKAFSVAWYRNIFADCYNFNDEGFWRWDEYVSDVPARPFSTPYEDTSYATQYKNVLFIVLDIFRQDDPDQQLHPKTGSIIADISGDHLEWLETMLSAARQNSSIKYIFIQTHLPILRPVRALRSSMLFFDNNVSSKLLNIFRKYKVDLYFAGEVHATTITKDSESDLVQIVTNRTMPIMITVYDDQIELQSFQYQEIMDETSTNPTYLENQTLTIDKSGDNVSFTNGSGVLIPLDTNVVFSHFPMDKLEPLNWCDSICEGSPNLLNMGALGCYYYAIAQNVEITDGNIGKGLSFSGNGVVDITAIDPFGFFSDEPQRTMSLWFKTSEYGEHYLLSSGRGIAQTSTSLNRFMDIILREGKIVIRTGTKTGILDSLIQSPALNDGGWHHVALVVENNTKTINGLQIYIDGTQAYWDSNVDQGTIIVTLMGSYGTAIGAPGKQSVRLRDTTTFNNGFRGSIDDVALWYRALSKEEILAIFELANGPEFKMNASQVDELFKLFRLKQGEFISNNILWHYASDLKGIPGTLIIANNGVTLILDKNNNGVIGVFQ